MTSSCIEIVIVCVLFWGNYFLLCRKGRPSFGWGELILFYLFARVLPFYMMEIRTPGMLKALVSEWVVIGCLDYYLSKRKDGKTERLGLCLYLFQPVTPYYILSGNAKAVCAVMVVLACLAFLDVQVSSKQHSLLEFLTEYLAGVTACFVYLMMPKLKVQAGMALGMVLCVLVKKMISMFRVPKKAEKTESVSGEDSEDAATDAAADAAGATGRTVDSLRKTDKWQKRDYIWLLLLTVVFGAAIMWKLGTTHSPQTYQSVWAGKGEKICLEFAEQNQPVTIYYYVGYSRKNDLMVQQEEWQAKGVYTWNQYICEVPMQQFTLDAVYGELRINEVVCMDAEEKVVYPVNRQTYASLFDEQDTLAANPTYFEETMFDEVYHARTAYEFLQHLSIYENTHPPLGKSIISIGIRLFGMNPFGWRSMSALFGILMIPLFYLFAFRMFGRTDASVCVTLLLGTSFMSTTLSRIATIDIFVAFFVLGLFYCMYGFVTALEQNQRWICQMLWLLGGGVFMGLAIATKWTGFYASAGAAVLFFVFLLKKLGGVSHLKDSKKYLIQTFCCCVFFFIVIPAAIYILSYLPFLPVYTDRTLIEQVIGNGQLMLDYHKNCVFDHPYSSEWYQWLIGCKPLADSRVYLGSDKVSVVMTFLNPLLCMGGLAAFLYQFYLWKDRRDGDALFLIIAYLSMLTPWFLVHRTVFIYQYFISALLLPFMLVNCFRHSRHPRRNGMIFAAASVLLYGLFYRVLTGRVESIEWINQALELFQDWNIA